MAEPYHLSRPPKSPGGLVDFVHSAAERPERGKSIVDATERRLHQLDSTLSPLKLPEIVEEELESSRLAKLRLEKQQKSKLEHAASPFLVPNTEKSVLAAMPEVQQDLREKQRVIDKIDADSERHRRFTSELERWLFDLRQDDKVRAERSERLAVAEDTRHHWNDQMQHDVENFKQDMARASKQTAEIRTLSGEVADEDEEESQLDRKIFELRKWKDTFDAQLDESRYRLETAVGNMITTELDFDKELILPSQLTKSDYKSSSIQPKPAAAASSAGSSRRKDKGKLQDTD